MKRTLEVPAFDNGILFGPPSMAKQDVYTTSTDKNYDLGTKLYLDSERIFRYSLNGAVALTKSLMTTSAAEVTDHKQTTQTGHAWAVGQKSGTVLISGTTTVADNEWRGGSMYLDAAAAGDEYRIVACHQTAATIVQVELETPIRNAIAVTDVVTIKPNRWSKVVVAATTVVGPATGVAIVGVAANAYSWLQTGGPCPVLTDTGETTVIGEVVGYPGTISIAGQCGVTEVTDMTWGTVMSVGAATKPSLIYLTLDS